GDVEPRARARPRAPPQRGQDGPEGMRAREHVGRLQARGPRRGQLPLLEVHETRGGLDDVGEGGALAPRSRLAKAGDGAVHEVGSRDHQRRVVAAEPRGHAGREVLHGHVGHAREVEEDPARLRAAKIEPETLLADVDAGEVRALIVPAWLELQVPLAHVIAAGRPLDLDDARAEVGEEPCAVRSGEHAREVEDDEAGEGTAAEQTRWARENVAAILAAAGSSLERVVQVTLLIQDPADYHEINAEYVKHFPNGLPARHTARFGVPTMAKVAFACIALASEAARARCFLEEEVGPAEDAARIADEADASAALEGWVRARSAALG